MKADHQRDAKVLTVAVVVGSELVGAAVVDSVFVGAAVVVSGEVAAVGAGKLSLASVVALA